MSYASMCCCFSAPVSSPQHSDHLQSSGRMLSCCSVQDEYAWFILPIMSTRIKRHENTIFFPVHTRHIASICIKFNKQKKNCHSFFGTKGRTMELTTSWNDVLVRVDLKKKNIRSLKVLRTCVLSPKANEVRALSVTLKNKPWSQQHPHWRHLGDGWISLKNRGSLGSPNFVLAVVNEFLYLVPDFIVDLCTLLVLLLQLHYYYY